MSKVAKNKQYFEYVKKRPIKYLISLIIVAAATFLQLSLSSLSIPSPPFLLFYPAILLAALYGDGISAIFLSILCIDYFFMGVGKLLDLRWPEDYIPLFIYILFAFYIRHITHKLALSTIRAEALVENLETEKALREQFVASLSHDLRNPISAANVSAQLYLKHPEKADLQKIMGRIVAATDRADKMIRDLLDANAIKAGEALSMQMGHCDLLIIAQEVIEEKSLKIGRSDRIKLERKDPVKGIWNGEALRRILENLIDNAFKYGDQQKEVTVNLFSDDSKAELLVHNYGNPLSLEEKNRIFEAFGRAHYARTSGKQGWGLGLTLVRGLAEAHGGTASVESGADGTTFIVTLPLDARVKK